MASLTGVMRQGCRRLSRRIWKRADRKRRKTEITPAGTVRQGRDRVLRAGLGEVQERSRAVGDYTGWLQLLRADGWQDQIRHLQCRRNRVRCDHPVRTIRNSGFWLRRRDYGSISGICVLGNHWSWKQKVGVSGE